MTAGISYLNLFRTIQITYLPLFNHYNSFYYFHRKIEKIALLGYYRGQSKSEQQFVSYTKLKINYFKHFSQ